MRRKYGVTALGHAGQEVWHGGKASKGEFLHSPLLEELRSLERNLGAPGVRARPRHCLRCLSRGGALLTVQLVHCPCWRLPMLAEDQPRPSADCHERLHCRKLRELKLVHLLQVKWCGLRCEIVLLKG